MSAKNPHDYYFKKIEIQSERFDTGVAASMEAWDITYMTLQLDIFEHIDKPYLTASLLFMDNSNLSSEMNLLGTERVTVTVSTTENANANAITKVFRISEITLSKKSNDETELHAIHLVEEHAYLSSINSIDGGYEDEPFKIIEKIMNNELNREIKIGKNAEPFIAEKMKIVAPGTPALKVCNWIKDRCNTETGSPFYMWSSLADDIIRFVDLENLLNTPAQNAGPGNEYWYSQAMITDATQNKDIFEQGRAITSYETLNSENHLYFAIKGLVNSQWDFYDPLTGKNTPIDFKMKEKYQDLLSRNILPEAESTFLLDNETKINNKIISDHAATDFFQLAPSQMHFEKNSPFRVNYYEEPNPTMHKLKVIGKALREWILKPQMSVTIAGLHFLRKGANLTIGNKIVIKFLRNNDDREYINKNYQLFDTKRSGEYLIYATRHTFSDEEYRVNHTLGKLSTYGNILSQTVEF